MRRTRLALASTVFGRSHGIVKKFPQLIKLFSYFRNMRKRRVVRQSAYRSPSIESRSAPHFSALHESAIALIGALTDMSGELTTNVLMLRRLIEIATSNDQSLPCDGGA